MAKPPVAKNHEIVAEIINTTDYQGNLIYVKDTDCLYTFTKGLYYSQVDPADIRRVIYDYAVSFHGDKNITSSLVTDLYTQIPLAVTNVRSVTSRDSCRYIVFDDGMLDTYDFTLSPVEQTACPSFYMPYLFADILTSQAPTFQQFLNTSLVLEDTTDPDTTLIDFMQEIFGYLLLGGINTAAAFFFVGNGSNGKSVMTSVIEAMFEEEYITSMSIETLTTDKFALSGLVGKRVNICNEEESKYIKSDKFKAIVSGDLVSGERKYGGRFDFHPNTKFVFCSNRLPGFDGINFGLKRRMKIVPFFRKFDGKSKDLTLTARLKTEMPGIIAWALAGAQRLVEQDYIFSDYKSASVNKAMRDFEDSTSSALQFFNEYYEITDDEFTPNTDLYLEYQAWCSSCGRKPLAAQNFHNDLAQNADVRKEVKYVLGKTARCSYVRRKDDSPPLPKSRERPDYNESIPF